MVSSPVLCARVLIAAPLVLFATLAGCGSGSSGGACSTSGTGTLVVTVAGIGGGANAAITVKGPTSTETVVATKTFTGIPAGDYTITADRLTLPDPIVRTVYAATISGAGGALSAGGAVCVGGAAMQTVTVRYAMVPTSNAVWIANSNAPNGDNTQGFGSSSIAFSGTVSATTAAKSGAGRKQAFDRDGNLWAAGGDPLLLMLSADSLATSGTKTPARGIGVPSIACVPAVAALAFASDGSLWFSSACGQKVYKLSPAQVAAGGTSVTPVLAIATGSGAEGLAFDKSGNLWVSTDDAQLLRFDAASLTSAAATPALTLGAKTSTSGGDLHPGWLAFDASGKLWTGDFGGNILFPFATADLAGTGTKSIVPTVQIAVGVSALLEGMAFDEGGGLWIPLDTGAFGRLSPTQLGASSAAGAPTTPERVIPAGGLGSVEDITLYPAPAALPLYSALP